MSEFCLFAPGIYFEYFEVSKFVSATPTIVNVLSLPVYLSKKIIHLPSMLCGVERLAASALTVSPVEGSV